MEEIGDRAPISRGSKDLNLGLGTKELMASAYSALNAWIGKEGNLKRDSWAMRANTPDVEKT